MNLYLMLILATSYMVITYHIISLKYKISMNFTKFSKKSKIFLTSLHVFIVISNIILYFWLISGDFDPVSVTLSASGIILFTSGLFIILRGMYSLKKMVFIPEDRLVIEGPYRFVRHPMYTGGITGAFGLALFAGSIPGFLYSVILALVLSHIADTEEKDLISRFGGQYIEYSRKVPRLLPV